MANLKYREDMDEVRKRLSCWWHGGDIGRPVLLLHSQRREPLDKIPEVAAPPDWITDYSIRDFDYRVFIARRNNSMGLLMGEAVPSAAPDLAPNCLALYLGCRGVESPGTVWCEPCMDSPEQARFEYDPDNIYWQFSLKLGRELLRVGRGKFLVSYPDLIEGLDTLAAMRGTEPLLFDLIERPEWIHACLRQITDRYFRYYDVLYDMFRDEVGGSTFWMWAPGRMAKFQCDFSAMIGPEMFGEFMVPVLKEMTERVSYSMYHWDGPRAIPHHDHLLSLPRLNMIQWTSGDGAEPSDHPRWWPLYHKTVDAGKKIFIGCSSIDKLKSLKREFGPKLKQFSIGMGFKDQREAEEIMRTAEI